jgi:endonuclease G
MGIPRDGDDTDDLLMDKGVYVLSYNPKLNDPNWVSWRLDRRDLGHADRQDNFRLDPELPANVYHVTPGDYVHSGYDRGHLCPSADRTRTKIDNSLTFFMTNMHPQRPELNRGPWADVEDYERTLVKQQHRELYVTVGGIFDEHPRTIGHAVAVPKAEYRVVVVLDEGQGVESVTSDTDVIAVIMPNEMKVQEKPWTQYVVSVDEIEHATGYDFLTRVPEDVQRAIESERAAIHQP